MKSQQEKKSLIDPRNQAISLSDPFKEQVLNEKEFKQ